MKKLIGLACLVGMLSGCATLSGLLGHKDAQKAGEVCANALADLETAYTIALTQIKDPVELDKLAKAHAVAVAALTDCVAKGK